MRLLPSTRLLPPLPTAPLPRPPASHYRLSQPTRTPTSPDARDRIPKNSRPASGLVQQVVSGMRTHSGYNPLRWADIQSRDRHWGSMSTTSIIVAVLVALITVTLNAFVNVTIKFSPDRKTAFEQLRGLIINAAGVLANLWLVISLGLELFSSEPVTRRSVVLIALSVGTLTLSIVYYLLRGVFRVQQMTVHALERQVAATAEIVRVVKSTAAPSPERERRAEDPSAG